MTLTEVIEEIEQLERVAPKLPTLTEAFAADRRLAALRARKDALTEKPRLVLQTPVARLGDQT